MKSPEEKRDSFLSSTLANAAGANSALYGEAGAEFIKGYKGGAARGLKDLAKSQVSTHQNLRQQAGFAGEILHESRTNARAIIEKKSVRLRRTDSLNMKNHQEFDHINTYPDGTPILDKNGNYTGTSQMKLRKGATQAGAEANVKQLTGIKEFLKYKNVESLEIPQEQLNDAKKYLAQRKVELKKQLASEDLKKKPEAFLEKKQELERVESVEARLKGSVKSSDAYRARVNPKLQTAIEIAKVAHEAGAKQAKIGFVIASSVALSKHIVSAFKGDLTEREQVRVALQDTALTGAKGAAASYVGAFSGTALTSIFRESSSRTLQSLSKTSLPATIVASVSSTSKALYKFAKDDDYDVVNLVTELGENGTGMIAGVWGAAAGTALIASPVIGPVVGSMIGVQVAGIIYNSSIKIIEEANLSEQQRIKVSQLANEALTAMQKEQDELVAAIESYDQTQKAAIEHGMNQLWSAIEHSNADAFTENISELAISFGISLKLVDFDEFDDFMNDETTTFRL